MQTICVGKVYHVKCSMVPTDAAVTQTETVRVGFDMIMEGTRVIRCETCDHCSQKIFEFIFPSEPYDGSYDRKIDVR